MAPAHRRARAFLGPQSFGLSLTSYTQPLTLICLGLIVLGILRLSRTGRKDLAVGGIVALFLLSWPPAAWLFSRPLEAWYPRRPFRAANRPEAIVVLGGGYSRPRYERPYPVPNDDTYQRCEHALWLYHRYGPVPVVASGGGFGKRQPVAELMRELLARGGVSENLIWAEERSLSTHENAVYSAEMLRQHGIRRVVLVVDATSMLRAASCFRKEGIEVDPAPNVFFQLGWSSDDLLPGWAPIRQNEAVLHEILGLAWYRLHGWI